MEDGNGVQPEDGKFLMPTFLFVELMESRKSTLGAVPSGPHHSGFGHCCAVCVDDADDRTRDRHGVPLFLEIKKRALEKLDKSPGKQALFHPHPFTSFLEDRESMEAPGRPGMCCTMCSANDGNGGWSGSTPFSDPMSEDQSINEQATDEESMRTIAHLRTYHHDSTVSDTYKDLASKLSEWKEEHKKEK